jgi:hypothetical protein
LAEAFEHETGDTTKRVTKRIKDYTAQDEVAMGEMVEVTEGKEGHEKDEDALPDIVVLASGNLGLVYGTVTPGRKNLEEIEKFYPGILDGLVAHEGVGFIMVSSEEFGPVIIGENGRHYIKEGRIEGEDPLANFGPRAAQHLLREDSFTNCPDILVNSFFSVESNEVAAFEELIGCHGGMGGYQTQPFLLYPAEWELDSAEMIIGAGSVYKQLKSWLGQVHHNGTS